MTLLRLAALLVRARQEGRLLPTAAALMHRAGLVPDPWQTAVLESGAPRLLLLCCRQSGKSTVTAALALHQALSVPGSLVLLLLPSLRQSSELFKVVLHFFRSMGERAAAESLLRLELRNGSRILALPGTEQTIRGFAGVALLVIDEAARVHDDLYYSVRPMLAVSGGRLIALTTPFGKRGFFYHEWMEGQEWERVQVTAPECPRISPDFLALERHSLPAMWFDSEYMCQFTETVDSVFRYADVQAALSPDVQPLFPRAS